MPSVYRVSDALPPDVKRRLAEKFGIRPGDSILRFPGESPPYTLHRDFDGVEAAELRTIIGTHLTRDAARPRRSPTLELVP